MSCFFTWPGASLFFAGVTVAAGVVAAAGASCFFTCPGASLELFDACAGGCTVAAGGATVATGC